jgi:hypothetical protein
MELFAEAGLAGTVSLVLFVVALVFVVRGKGGARAFAVAILATGVTGFGVGERMVTHAAEAAPELSTRVAFLTMGTREASANLLLSGVMALLLIAIAGAVERVRGSADA